MFKAANDITSDLLVTDIVNNNYRTADVFRKYNIDFCCGGKMPLRMACELNGLDESDLLEELEQFSNADQNAEQWSVDFMIDYLINVHHNYIKNNIPIVSDYINSFVVSHDKKFMEFQQLPTLTQLLCNKLIDQINYESTSLFPYIKRIVYAHKNNEIYGKHLIKTLHKLSAEDLEQYHAQMKVFILEIERITNNFTLPENPCTTHRVMLQKLHEFVDYIWQHIFIEKKYLIPITLQMEKSLLEKYTEK